LNKVLEKLQVNFINPQNGEKLFLHEGILINETKTKLYKVEENYIDFIELDSVTEYDKHWEEANFNEIIDIKKNQAAKFTNWIANHRENKTLENIILLDVGCGDGNHIPFIPDNTLAVLLDYSYTIKSLSEKYKHKKNLLFIRGSALELPFDENMFDVSFAYSCINLTPDVQKGVNEIVRVTKPKGNIALWGYQATSRIEAGLLHLTRAIYKSIPTNFLKNRFIDLLIPFLIIFKNSTNINPLNSKWHICKEIVSTNLVPDNFYLFVDDEWSDLVGNSATKIADYDMKCGQLFEK